MNPRSDRYTAVPISQATILPAGDYVSFHDTYDLAEYAGIFGPFETVTYEGGRMLVSLTDGIAMSGPGASFGGLLFNPRYVWRPRLEAITEMLRTMTCAITRQVPTSTAIHLRLAPDTYYPAPFIQALRAALAIAGWTHLGEVTHVVTPDSYRPRPSTVRNARRAKERLSVCRLDPGPCFDFISAIKVAKGYRFGYSRPRFLEQVQRFPDRFHCHGVLNAVNQIVAASFELANGDWALLLNWDQNEEGRSLAAVDYLLLERVEGLFAAGCRFVDMGTTTEERKPNWGLIRHKENFGGAAILRNNYALRLRG